jgi:SAM-dependent methyltransferase
VAVAGHAGATDDSEVTPVAASSKEPSCDARTYLERAYTLSGPEDIKALYRDWASSYDRDVIDELGLVSPEIAADMLLTRIEAPEALGPVLDIGCGTGLAGVRLRAAGVATIDGLDLSREMLAAARRRGIYRALVECDVNKPLPFAGGAYDAAISTGLFTLGHVDARPLVEIVRVIRPGGAFAASIHRDIYIDGGFKNTFDALIKTGRITDFEVIEKPLFQAQDDTGRYVVFRRSPQ